MAAETKTFTAEELASLNQKDNVHLCIHGKVYAVAPFVDEHPGGDEVLLSEAGKDATDAFEDVGHSEEAREILDKFLVGKAPDAFKGPSASDAGAGLSQRSTTNPIKAVDRLGNRGDPMGLAYLFPLAALVAYLAYRYYSK